MYSHWPLGWAGGVGVHCTPKRPAWYIAAEVVRDAKSGVVAGEEGRCILLTDQALQGSVLMLSVLLSFPLLVSWHVLWQLGRERVTFT